MNRQTRFREIFRFRRDIRKNVYWRSQRLRWRGVSIVNDYADTMSAWSTATRTYVSVINEYADIVSALLTTTLTHGKLFYCTLEKVKSDTLFSNFAIEYIRENEKVFILVQRRVQ